MKLLNLVNISKTLFLFICIFFWHDHLEMRISLFDKNILIYNKKHCKLMFWKKINENFANKYHYMEEAAAIFLHSSLPIFAWWMIMLHFFDSKQLLHAYCTWWYLFVQFSLINVFIYSSIFFIPETDGYM